ncbi:MAG: hypothetical protein Q9226_003066 [Calogaya cf. arnoldii]
MEDCPDYNFVGEGKYIIMNAETQECLSAVPPASFGGPEVVATTVYQPTNMAQVWEIRPVSESGVCSIVNTSCGKSLVVEDDLARDFGVRLVDLELEAYLESPITVGIELFSSPIPIDAKWEIDMFGRAQNADESLKWPEPGIAFA